MTGTVERRLAAITAHHGLPSAALPALRALLELLARPQAPTAVHDATRAIDVHVADSLVGLEVPELRDARQIADLGSGAGLPGLVLAAALPDARAALVEASARKCDFLREAVDAMALVNVAVVWSRVEEWSDGLGECDVVTARAVAALPVLCEYAAPLLRRGGVLVAWKGAVRPSEAADARAAAAHLGLEIEPARTVVPYAGSERRTLHVVRKVGTTPSNYPRRAGIATKRPLSATNLR
jgi:16S rRNA (guanine527-N7)-methyltransferase